MVQSEGLGQLTKIHQILSVRRVNGIFTFIPNILCNGSKPPTLNLFQLLEQTTILLEFFYWRTTIMHFPFTTVTHWLINYELSNYLKNLHMSKQNSNKKSSRSTACTYIVREGPNFFTTFISILAQVKCFTNLK